MKVALIARSTLYKVHGGITVQVLATAKNLSELGIDAVVHLTNEKINYNEFDLLHFFDITRPANILYHIKKSTKPFVLSPILINYSEYDKQHRKGLSGIIFRTFPPSANEYLKAISRWLLKKDSLQSKNYLWKGHTDSIQDILQRTEMILPNSQHEYDQLKALYHFNKPYTIVPNGIDDILFHPDGPFLKDDKLVLCAARIEGIKNQFNLIKALNNTDFKLILIGDPSPNQKKYYNSCKKVAAKNIEFIPRVSQDELKSYYQNAKVHILPSWFETCGLSSLEAAAMGCNIVISDKGYSREYFEDDAFYCDPGSPESIYDAVKKASERPYPKTLQEKISINYTWKQAAIRTLEAYKNIAIK